MLRVTLAFLLALPFMPAVAAQERPYTIGNPDRRLWTQREAGWGTPEGTTFVCSHSLCPRGTSVTISDQPGPARRPDAAALRRLASEDVARQLASLAADRAAPRLTATTAKGLPAIRGAFPISGGASGAAGASVAQVYMDGRAVRLIATSSDPAFTRRAIDAFLEAMTFRGR
jgi:hypothetical protein